jgi:hypothetical protein
MEGLPRCDSSLSLSSTFALPAFACGPHTVAPTGLGSIDRAQTLRKLFRSGQFSQVVHRQRCEQYLLEGNLERSQRAIRRDYHTMPGCRHNQGHNADTFDGRKRKYRIPLNVADIPPVNMRL